MKCPISFKNTASNSQTKTRAISYLGIIYYTSKASQDMIKTQVLSQGLDCRLSNQTGGSVLGSELVNQG